MPENDDLKSALLTASKTPEHMRRGSSNAWKNIHLFGIRAFLNSKDHFKVNDTLHHTKTFCVVPLDIEYKSFFCERQQVPLLVLMVEIDQEPPCVHNMANHHGFVQNDEASRDNFWKQQAL